MLCLGVRYTQEAGTVANIITRLGRLATVFWHRVSQYVRKEYADCDFQSRMETIVRAVQYNGQQRISQEMATYVSPIMHDACAVSLSVLTNDNQDHCIRVIQASDSKVAFQASTDAPVGALCAFSKNGTGSDQVSSGCVPQQM